MFPSHNPCLTTLRQFIRTFLQQIKALNNVKRCKTRKPKRLFSGFNWITSPFAAMEVQNQLKQVFELIDTNGDGKISSLELGELLLSLGHEKSTVTNEAEVMVKEVDCNGDGYIDLEEFMDIVGGNNNKENELMDAFLIFDSDKNGFISAKELHQVLVSLGYDKCTLEECLLMIKGVDKDGDGLVNFEEFRSMMAGCAA